MELIPAHRSLGAQTLRRRGFRILWSVEHVADTSNRTDHLYWKFIIDFAAQVADVDIHDISEAVVVHVPDVFHNHRTAQWPAAIPHHVLENAEFLRREFNVVIVASDFAPDAIET